MPVCLTAIAAALVVPNEIMRYPIDQTHRYRVELGVGGDETDELARRASERLAAAGERALIRSDARGARVLLERARALVPVEERPLELEILMVHARFDVGDLAEALVVADEL